MCRVCVTMHRTCSGCQCLCVRTGLKPCMSTVAPPSFYAWTMHVSRSSWNESACTWNIREACVFGRAPPMIHAKGVRLIFVEYCTVFARMRQRVRYFSDSSVIVNDTCVVHAWFMRDSSVISTPDTLKILDAQARTNQSVQNLWMICAWSAVWLAL